MRLEVTFDARAATARLRNLQRGIQDRAIVRALNKTASGVRTDAARLISRELGRMKVGDVRKSIGIKRASRGSLEARVIAGGRRRISITQLGARQTARGVTVRVRGRVHQIPGAFIESSGRSQARIRSSDFRALMVDQVPPARRRRVQAGGPDYPAAEIFAPGIPVLFIESGIRRALIAGARTRWDKAIAQEVRFELSRAGIR